MNPMKRLSGVCGQCGGPIEFQAELIGTMATCPRCRKQTELQLATPPEEPSVPRRVIIWSVVTAGILVLGLVLTVAGLKHYERLMARQKNRAAEAGGAQPATLQDGFEVSAVSLEKGERDNKTYVVGTVVNTLNRPRSQVTVEFELFDAGGQGVEVARAYRPTLGAGAKWEIRVAVEGSAQAVSAKLASVKVGQ